MINKDRYDISIINDIVSISANDLFDDELRKNSFLLHCTSSTLSRIYNLMEGAIKLEVGEYINETGNFGNINIYDADNNSECIHVYEIRLPDNKLQLNSEDIEELRLLMGELSKEHDKNVVVNRNNRVYSEETIRKAVEDLADKNMPISIVGENGSESQNIAIIGNNHRVGTLADLIFQSNNVENIDDFKGVLIDSPQLANTEIVRTWESDMDFDLSESEDNDGFCSDHKSSTKSKYTKKKYRKKKK